MADLEASRTMAYFLKECEITSGNYVYIYIRNRYNRGIYIQVIKRSETRLLSRLSLLLRMKEKSIPQSVIEVCLFLDHFIWSSMISETIMNLYV